MSNIPKESNKRGIIIAISLFFMIFARYFPTPDGMTQAAMQVIGIFIGVLILWMTISIDWPSMLCIGAIAMVPGMTMSSILAGSAGNSTFSFLMFTFMCTYTLSQTPFIRRCAIAFITNKTAQKGPWQFMILYFASVLFLGSIMSPTVLVIVFLTITEEIYAVLGLEKGSKVANMMMMGMVFCSGISAGMTPIAHVFPLMALGYFTTATGNAIGYAQYMAVGIPVAIISTIAMLCIFKFILKPNMNEIKTLDVTSLKSQLAPMDRREVTVLVVFFSVVFLWVVPGLVKPIFPAFYTFVNSLGTAWPPLIGAVVLSIFTYKGEPILNFKEATSKGIPWASLIMTMGTLTLGSAMTNKNIGLTTWISEKIAPFAMTLAPLALVFLFVAWTSLQTNLSSNMVTVTVVCAIAIPITLATNGGVNTAAIVTLIGMMASYAFATPPAMATVVFAIGSGWTTTGDMAKYGFTLILIATIIAALIGYPIANALM